MAQNEPLCRRISTDEFYVVRIERYRTDFRAMCESEAYHIKESIERYVNASDDFKKAVVYAALTEYWKQAVPMIELAEEATEWDECVYLEGTQHADRIQELLAALNKHQEGRWGIKNEFPLQVVRGADFYHKIDNPHTFSDLHNLKRFSK